SKNRLPIWWTVFDIENKEKQLRQLEHESMQPHFWEDRERATAASQQISRLKEEIGVAKTLEKEFAEVQELQALVGEDQSLAAEFAKKCAALKQHVDREEFRVFLSGKYDAGNALLEIFSGAGGQDAQDWATMLLRMYERYSAKRGFSVKIVHQSFGTGGGPEGRIGIKSVTLEVAGAYAYGLLKKETGVHRLVRISPFSAQQLRHTSFASVNVLPEIAQPDARIQVRPEDLTLETFRASGPGGQYVNKTES